MTEEELAKEASEALRQDFAGREGRDVDDITHFLRACDRLFPKLLTYRGGGWFVDGPYVAASVDLQLDNLSHDLAAVEASINNVDLLEDYPRRSDVTFDDEAEALAKVLCYSWSTWARVRYGVTIKPTISRWDEEAVMVTFTTADTQ